MSSPAPTPDVARPPSARGRAFLLLAFVLLYGVACWLPALHLTGRRDVFAGVEVMVLGPLSLRLGQFAWLANLPAVLALYFVMKGRTGAAMTLSGAAFVLGLHTFWLLEKEIPLGEESFNKVRVVSVGVGAYVWLAALLLPLAAAFLLRHQRPVPRSDLLDEPQRQPGPKRS